MQRLIQWKYLPNIIDAPDKQYICVHCNAGVTYTNNIGDLPGAGVTYTNNIGDLPVYSNIFWYNPNVIANILSLLFLHKNHMVTYSIKYGNKFVVHIPQQLTFKTTKSGIFYHDMNHLLKNKNNTHIMVNY